MNRATPYDARILYIEQFHPGSSMSSPAVWYCLGKAVEDIRQKCLGTCHRDGMPGWVCWLLFSGGEWLASWLLKFGVAVYCTIRNILLLDPYLFFFMTHDGIEEWVWRHFVLMYFCHNLGNICVELQKE